MTTRPARALILTFAVAASLWLAAPAQASFPGHNGKIAFGYGGNVQTINPDGTGRATVTSGTDPAWSADGGRLAFVHTHAPNNETDIFVSEGDGSSRTQVTHEEVCPAPEACGQVDSPSWSPDGRKIAYGVAVYEGGTYREWTSVLDLTTGETTKVGDFLYYPAWSPDGRKIAFSYVGGIAVARPDGTDYTILTRGLDFHPSWSPDGSKIAFFRSENYDHLYTMNADGTNQVRLTNGEAHDLDPAWSPDGTKIVFTKVHLFSNNDGFTINVDGTGETGLAADAVQPDWQPIPAANQPPDCSSVTATPSSLQPANGHFRTVTLAGATDPDGDTVTITIDGVTQDETVGRQPDARTGQSADQAVLRAERHPHGDGRVYRIAYTASDGRDECSGVATVEVPRHNKLPAFDSAPPSFDSFGS